MNMQLHHIGYVTGNIEATANEFARLGYKANLVVDDSIQKCKICILTSTNGGGVELIEPFAENKPLNKLLTLKGVAPYHLCYEVEDVNSLFEELSATEGWTPLFRPVNASAFNNRLITYFWNESIGFIEFLNKD